MGRRVAIGHNRYWVPCSSGVETASFLLILLSQHNNNNIIIIIAWDFTLGSHTPPNKIKYDHINNRRLWAKAHWPHSVVSIFFIFLFFSGMVWIEDFFSFFLLVSSHVQEISFYFKKSKDMYWILRESYTRSSKECYSHNLTDFASQFHRDLHSIDSFYIWTKKIKIYVIKNIFEILFLISIS